MTDIAVAALTEQEAERLSNRISLRIESMADAWTGALPLIREAIEREAYKVLGYPSQGAYVSERFGDALARLPITLRRQVVHELSDGGMSIRDIASVTGVSVGTVHNDQQVFSPEHLDSDVEADVDEQPRTIADYTLTDPEPTYVDASTGEVVDAPRVEEHTVTEKTKVTVGHDGKSYPKSEPSEPRRRSLVDDAWTARRELEKALGRLQAVRADDRFTRNKADIQDALRPVVGLANEVLPDFA